MLAEFGGEDVRKIAIRRGSMLSEKPRYSAPFYPLTIQDDPLSSNRIPHRVWLRMWGGSCPRHVASIVTKP